MNIHQIECDSCGERFEQTACPAWQIRKVCRIYIPQIERAAPMPNPSEQVALQIWDFCSKKCLLEWIAVDSDKTTLWKP